MIGNKSQVKSKLVNCLSITIENTICLFIVKKVLPNALHRSNARQQILDIKY